MVKVVVLGGGISGLAAAHRLVTSRGSQTAEEGIQVRLLESSARLGGVLETVHADRYLIERSADNFATLIPDALTLSQECGLEAELVRPNAEGRQAFVWHKSGAVPIPAGFSLMQPTRIASILATPTLSWRGKLRVVGEYFVGKRPAASQDEDESLEDFAVRRLGREAFESLVEPIVSGIFTANPRTLSMRATMPQFVEMEQRHGGLIRGYLASKKQDAAAAARRASGARYDQFMAPKGGMNHWIAGIAATLPSGTVQLSCQVQGVKPIDASQGWEVTYRTADGQLRSEQCDAVVCALPAAVAGPLISAWAPKAGQLISAIEYASSVVYAAVVKRSELAGRLDGFGLIVPSKYGREALAISYTSNKYPGRVPDDEILLRVFLGGAMKPAVIDWDDQRIEQVAQREMRELVRWNGTRPQWQGIIRWRNAMPQYLVGHVARLGQIQSALASHPTFRTCGAAYQGVGIPQCVRGARQAADDILTQLAQGDR